MPPSPVAFSIGETIDGRYRILGHLGAGSMGVVVRAEDVFLRRPVALKSLDPGIEHEARALARVRHENVVQVYAFGVHDGVGFFAMELVEGDTLQDRLDAHLAQGACLEPRTVTAIVAAVARGLDAVHARGLVHRDVKPANIVLERGTERPVLVDFGLAKRTGGIEAHGATGGTPLYMAPEQASDVDGTATCAASDQYALACTAFELLTGRTVFERDDLGELLSAHIFESAPLVSTLRPSLAPLDATFARALAKEPGARHRSCADFASELEAAVARIGSRTIPPLRSSQVRRGRRVVIFAQDVTLARHLVRAAERALPDAPVRDVASVEDLVAAVNEHTAAVVLDDDSLRGAGALEGLLDRIENVSRAQIVLLTRAWATTSERATALRARGVRVVAKPISAPMLSAVLASAHRNGDPEDGKRRSAASS